MPKLTYHSTTTVLIFVPMLLNLFQLSIGMETYHIQPSHVTHGPIPYPNPLSPSYVIVLPWRLFHRILQFAASRKEYHIDTVYRFRDMSVWNLSPDSREAPPPKYTCTNAIYKRLLMPCVIRLWSSVREDVSSCYSASCVASTVLRQRCVRTFVYWERSCLDRLKGFYHILRVFDIRCESRN